jgi:hypothetical protein
MSEDDRSANERLRIKHIRTLEMLQKVINENAILQEKLKQLEGGEGGGTDSTHELRELQFKYELKCQQVEDAEAQADKRRLCVQEQADVRIGSEQKKCIEATRKNKALEQNVQELTVKLAALSKMRPSSAQPQDTSELEHELKACQEQLVILQKNLVVAEQRMTKREQEFEKNCTLLERAQWEAAAQKKRDADRAIKEESNTRRASLEQEMLAQQVKELHQVVSQMAVRESELEQTNGKLQEDTNLRQSMFLATTDELRIATEKATEKAADADRREAEIVALQSELKRISAKVVSANDGGQQTEADTPVSSAQAQHMALLKKENYRLRLQIEEMRQTQKKFLRGGASQTSIFPGIQQSRRR